MCNVWRHASLCKNLERTRFALAWHRGKWQKKFDWYILLFLFESLEQVRKCCWHRFWIAQYYVLVVIRSTTRLVCLGKRKKKWVLSLRHWRLQIENTGNENNGRNTMRSTRWTIPSTIPNATSLWSPLILFSPKHNSKLSLGMDRMVVTPVRMSHPCPSHL